ncbi:GAF and ANTAR domain-containing protein [Actinokineospora sp. NBRC 105648]|uniref:GAF and ANTAR domain-containing protein n=1 Tax=Actinokineospora sp. NBRC 105648 TaxID=3032206 RepID=UPI0024A48455|nr:GAF and ANTAR domain-containing protein [Actinokineospora sp. NBRC 105648]GLZ38057.1 GAF domain-containing protein [Actinokineospora sp. NBRC 105648]
MVEDRLQRLRDLLAADRLSRPAAAVRLVCERCLVELSISGAGATVLSHLPGVDSDDDRLGRGLVYATNAVSAGLEDLQLTVGEGPCLDAFASGGPVLVADLAAETARWPAFTRAACDLGAAAVFSFPLEVGVVRLGSLDLYRDTAGPLTRVELADALILADLATQGVVADLDGHDTEDVSWLADPHVEVHQAAGMVQVQLGTTTDVALMRLRAHAFTHDLPLAEVARRVVGRTLRFTDDKDGH